MFEDLLKDVSSYLPLLCTYQRRLLVRVNIQQSGESEKQMSFLCRYGKYTATRDLCVQSIKVIHFILLMD